MLCWWPEAQSKWTSDLMRILDATALTRGFAIAVLVVLGICRNLGCRTTGVVPRVLMWFALGVLAVPLGLVLVGCWSLLSSLG